MNFENFKNIPIEDNESEKKNESQKNHFDVLKMTIERKTGKKLPENKEQLFRDFDNLVAKDIDHIDIADKVKPEDKHNSLYRYNREGIKSELEKDLYGATMKEINDYFTKELNFAEKELDREQRNMEIGYIKTYDSRLLKEHDKVQESVNCLSAGIIEFPLAYIELKIYDIHISESEKDKLRKFAERLSAERYKDMKNRPENNVSIDDVKKQIRKESIYFSDFKINEDDRNDNIEHFNNVLGGLDNGNITLASKEIESSIGRVQERLEEIKNKDLKDNSKKALKERYGENFMFAVNKELEKLRSLRKFLNSRMD